MEKSLDKKLARMRTESSRRDFILVDAKDVDIGAGVSGLGKTAEGRTRTIEDYRDEIRQNVEQGLIDVMLMSASNSERLAIEQGIFRDSRVTPAVRANDTTDIQFASGAIYPSRPSRPFRTTTLDHIMYGRLSNGQNLTVVGADLGLYSITFNNDVDHDLETIEHYRDFRIEAERKGFRHFLEVFNPNACDDHCPPDIARYVNDMITRTLAGVVGAGRPLFLKMPYNGPAAMEEIAGYDRSLIVGILGGASGTTFDAFHQLHEARKYGARAATYGRMINNSEEQRTMIQHLHWIASGHIDDPAEAVRSYHNDLRKLRIKPYRTLNDDVRPTNLNSVREQPKRDFGLMSDSDKVNWSVDKWNKVLG